MEIPAAVLVHNELLGIKGSRGILIRLADGYYEINLHFGEKTHRVLLPIATTVLIARDAELFSESGEEIER